YRHADAALVWPLVDALRALGLAVWFDQNAIDDFASITGRIREGLAGSKALLAWYSEAYPRSRPCQMELSAAFIAALKGGDPRRRSLVVNPDTQAAHIEPIELRDELFQQVLAPGDAAAYASLAERVKAHLSQLAGPMGAILPPVPPPQHGLKLTGSNRFVGRASDLWRLHSALNVGENAIISGVAAGALAQVQGMGGVGKSLLAEEYALRFGAAYTGGVFWLRALGHDRLQEASPNEREAYRSGQFRDLAVAAGVDVDNKDQADVEPAFARALGQAGKPYLWVVD